MKNRIWPRVKDVLFTYLAINKILYWMNTINALEQADFGSVSNAILSRFLNQDLLLIVIVIAFFYLDDKMERGKLKYRGTFRYVLFYFIGYFIMIGIIVAYNLLTSLIFFRINYSIIDFLRALINFLPGMTIGYLATAVVLEIKQYFKAKEKEKAVQECISKTESEK